MIIIHDKRLPAEYVRGLKAKLPNVSFVPFSPPVYSDRKVYESILCHTDIYFFELDEKTIIHAPSVGEKYLRILREMNMTLIKGNMDPKEAYPDTALYNAIRAGNTVFCKTRCIDAVVLEEIKKKKLDIIEVSQGYARCSVLKVNDKALITSDKGIAAAARGTGIEVLLLPAGQIQLPGEKYGFIGGAYGKTPSGKLIFLGDFKLHPQAEKIEDFLFKHSVLYIGVEGLPLYDAGGLII
ncbi:MAG: hypothetical protein ISS33_05265 [Candidatus Omnitrophica bacterium]|nr:hypothetical protein [Candidatus Omnitrophota bacterium]